jgi:cellulose synthase/poly-beta-1,6-N-acetylglucosamine synthase-like glycosyltransferase
VLIAAHNEASIMAEKIETTLALDYPNFEIIVSSDGSTDETVDIARGYANYGIRVISTLERGGKGAALNRAAVEARNEILIVSDANAFPAKDALRKLVRSFVDPEVGCVSGRVFPQTSESGAANSVTQGEGSYWRYEGFIKAAESRLASSTGVVGSLLAVRRELFAPIPPKNHKRRFASHAVRYAAGAASNL